MQPTGYYIEENCFCPTCMLAELELMLKPDDRAWETVDFHGVPEVIYDVVQTGEYMPWPIFNLTEVDYPEFCSVCDAYIDASLTDEALDYIVETFIEPGSELEAIVDANNLQLAWWSRDDLDHVLDLIEPGSFLETIVHEHGLVFTYDRGVE